MRLIIPVLLAAASCSSCTTFQYLTVQSTTLPYAEKKFTTVKDSIEVGYQFDGHNAVLLLDITNNRAEPVTVDWKRSAIITNGISISLYNPELPISASAAYDTLHNSLPVRSTTVTGSIRVPGETDFIPPFSAIQKKTVTGISRPLAVQLDGTEKITRQTVLQDKITVPGKNFTPENTPCKIRVYLTYTTGNNPQSRSIEDEFFIAALFESTRSPATIEELFGTGQPVIYTY